MTMEKVVNFICATVFFVIAIVLFPVTLTVLALLVWLIVTGKGGAGYDLRGSLNRNLGLDNMDDITSMWNCIYF